MKGISGYSIKMLLYPNGRGSGLKNRTVQVRIQPGAPENNDAEW